MTPVPKVGSSPVHRVWQHLRRADATILLLGVLVAVLLVLVANPVIRLLIESVQRPRTGVPTLHNFVVAYGDWRHIEALWNTLLFGIGVMVVTTACAVPLAWAVSRTDMPGKNFIRYVAFGSFILPPYLGAIGWILLAAPNSGVLNTGWMHLTGSDTGPFNIFSYTGLVLVVSMNLYFYIFTMASTAFDMISSELEDAANILGAGMLHTAFKVTLPLALPAIMGGMIVTFLQAIALFGVPALIAIPARFPVMSTQLWEFFQFPVQVQVAAAYALPLLVVTIGLLLLQRHLLARKGYVTVGGKGGERRIIRLGWVRWAFFGYAILVGALALFLPGLVLIEASLSRAWGQPFSLQNVTLAHFTRVLVTDGNTQLTILHSFAYAAASACFAIGLTIFIAYAVHRKLVPFRGLLAFLCMAPIVIPGIVLAIGFYAAYAPPPLALYGTAAILILSFTTRFLPLAYSNSSAAVQTIHPEMEEAVRILGGTRMLAIGKVVAPLLKKSLLGSWILIFVPAIQELSTAIFLTGPNTRVISVAMLDLSEEGDFGTLSALGLVLVAVTMALVALGIRLLGRDFMLRRK